MQRERGGSCSSRGGGGGRGSSFSTRGSGGGGESSEREQGGGGSELIRGEPHGSERDRGYARGLDLYIEAAMAAEKVWDLREAWASLTVGPEMEQDSPSPSTDKNAKAAAEAEQLFQKALATAEADQLFQKTLAAAEAKQLFQKTFVVFNSEPVEDWSHRLNRLMAMQKSAPAANGTNKRKRSTSVVNASNIEQLDVESASSPTPASPIQKKHKRISSKRSLVWNYFKSGLRGQDPIATCNHCGQIYSCDHSTHGTSTLWYHLRNLCPEDPLKGQDIRNKKQGTPKQPFNIEDCRKVLADMVIIDELPFRSVEGVGFRRYSKVLQPRFEPPSRVTVARDCLQRYIEEKPKLKKVLENQRICLTTDTWTSNQNLSYMCLTAHWVDDHWRLQKRILNYCSVADHKGETLGKRVEECLLE